MNHQQRIEIKTQIKPLILHHLSTFILIYLPLMVVAGMSFLSSKMAQMLPKVFIISLIALVIWGFKKYMSLGVHFKMLDIIRYKGSNLKQFRIPKFNKLGASLTALREHHIKDIFCIGFWKFIWTVVWAILVVLPMAIFRATHTMSQLWWILILLSIPVIVKACYSYIQAQYIYRDAIHSHQQLSYSGSISMSKLLMHGHRLNYLMLQFSFVGWVLIPVIIIAGLTYIFTQSITMTKWCAIGVSALMIVIMSPYIKMMELIFYQDLVIKQANNGSLFYTEIMDQWNK